MPSADDTTMGGERVDAPPARPTDALSDGAITTTQLATTTVTSSRRSVHDSLQEAFKHLAAHVSLFRKCYEGLKALGVGRDVKTRDFKNWLPKLVDVFGNIPDGTTEPLIKFALLHASEKTEKGTAGPRESTACPQEDPIAGCAQCFVSHAWEGPLLEVFETILNYAESPDTPRYFILDILSLERASFFKSAREDEKWARTFRSCINKAGRLLLVFSPFFDAVPLKRAWCLYELYIAYSSKDCGVDIRVPPSLYVQFIEDIHKDPHRFFEVLVNVNAENAEATIPEDKERILQDIRVGDKGGKGLDRFNTLVKENIRQWFYGFCTRIAEFVPNHHHRYSLAVLLSQHGRVELADEILRLSCSDTHSAEESTPFYCAKVLCQRGNIHFQMAAYEKAAEFYARCDTFLPAAIVDSPDADKKMISARAFFLYNVGNNKRLLNDCAGALKKMDESEHLFERIHVECSDIMFVCDGRARILSMLGRHDEAVKEAERARDKCEATAPSGQQKLALGQVKTGLGFAYLRRATANAPQDMQTSSDGAALAHACHQSEGGTMTLSAGAEPTSDKIKADFQRANDCLREALEARREVLGEEHQYVVAAYHNLGIAMVGLGNYDGALENVTKSVDLCRRLRLALRLERHEKTLHLLQSGMAAMRDVEPHVFPHATLVDLTAQIPVLGVQISIDLLFQGAVI